MRAICMQFFYFVIFNYFYSHKIIISHYFLNAYTQTVSLHQTPTVLQKLEQSLMQFWPQLLVNVVSKWSNQRCESYQIGTIDGPNHTKTVRSKVRIVSNWYD